ncbi:uncharacterized protein LAESUDRAFT_639546, partial [Laetiporus sulphureus 93-53]
QLGYASCMQQEELSRETIQYVIGDKLTADRIRGLQQFCGRELNSLDRLDFIVPAFRWLHLQVTFVKSLHKQYLRTDAGMGLKHAFTLLEHKGLDQVSTKGPFHDNLECVLCHVLEAHIRTCWL